jgi:hypothetical protein
MKELERDFFDMERTALQNLIIVISQQGRIAT